jgi:hypothetical protein
MRTDVDCDLKSTPVRAQSQEEQLSQVPSTDNSSGDVDALLKGFFRVERVEQRTNRQNLAEGAICSGKNSV